MLHNKRQLKDQPHEIKILPQSMRLPRLVVFILCAYTCFKEPHFDEQ